MNDRGSEASVAARDSGRGLAALTVLVGAVLAMAVGASLITLVPSIGMAGFAVTVLVALLGIALFAALDAAVR